MMNTQEDLWDAVVREFNPLKDILRLKLGPEREFAICLLRELKVEVDKDGNFKLEVHLSKNVPGLGSSAEKKRLREICLRNPAPLEFVKSLKPGANPPPYRGGPPFRWASAGCLPLFRIEGKHYCVLFLRGIPPFGWNVANGASEDAEEFWHLQKIITREFKEELLVVNIAKGLVYRLEPPDEPGVSVSRHRARALKMWNLEAELYPDVARLKELNGFDRVVIHADWAGEHSVRHVEKVFLSINPEDGEMGIEVLRAIEWELDGKLSDNAFYDGEITMWSKDGLKREERLIKRPVGLFDVDDLVKAFQENDSPFARPAVVFDEGKRIEGSELASWCAETPHSSDWCPVSIKTLRRFVRSKTILQQIFEDRYYSCFISYSHNDEGFANWLCDRLQGCGVRCWLDKTHLLPGDDQHEGIGRGIRLWDKVLLCASKSALTSWWVDGEINRAFQAEAEMMRDRSRRVLKLIPLNLDGFLFSDDYQSGKKAEIKSRVAANFVGWEKDHALFDRELEKVIRALRTDEGGRENPPQPKL